MLDASSYEEKALELIATMMANSAAWQELCEASGDAASALQRIVLRWGGDATTGQTVDESTGYDEDGDPLMADSLTAVSITGDEIRLDDGLPYALLNEAEASQHVELAPGVWQVTGAADLLVTIPALDADTAPEIIRRATNAAGAILADLRAQVGTATGIYGATLSMERPETEGPMSNRPTRTTTAIRIAWGE